MNNEKLSKLVSYILRHAPWEYELELDAEGWVMVDELLSALNKEKSQIDINDLNEMIKTSSKQRHEIKGNKIRALYGHSTPHILIKEESMPPDVLYHGTSPHALENILESGLKPMTRQYVHLSIDEKMANLVGSRKSPHPVLLLIKAREAYLSGIKFYIGNEKVWLADSIPSEFIEVKH